MKAWQSAGAVISVLAMGIAAPAQAQRQPPSKRPSGPVRPRPPLPPANDLLLGSAVGGGVFEIAAAAASTYVRPGGGPKIGHVRWHPRRQEMSNR